jgi:hypothetical protein
VPTRSREPHTLRDLNTSTHTKPTTMTTKPRDSHAARPKKKATHTKPSPTHEYMNSHEAVVDKAHLDTTARRARQPHFFVEPPPKPQTYLKIVPPGGPRVHSEGSPPFGFILRVPRLLRSQRTRHGGDAPLPRVTELLLPFRRLADPTGTSRTLPTPCVEIVLDL